MFIEKLNRQDFIDFTESLGLNNAINDIQVITGKRNSMVVIEYVDETMERVRRELETYSGKIDSLRLFVNLLATGHKYNISNTLTFTDFSCGSEHKNYNKEWQKYLSNKFPTYKKALLKNEELNK